MSAIGMLSLSEGLAKALRRKHRANSFPWAHVLKASLANSIILTTKIRNIIVPQLLNNQVSLKRIMRRKNLPFPQNNPKKLTLLPQLKLKGREEEKEKGKAKVAKEKERRAKTIDNLRSVQSPLSRPRSIYMVPRGQKKMSAFLNIPMD